MATITEHDLVSKVLELAKKHPEATYHPDWDSNNAGSYSYVWGSAGAGQGCIFGQALRELGVPEQDLLKFEESGRIDVSIASLVKYLKIDVDRIHVLEIVQESQDCGSTWNHATRILRREGNEQ